MVQFFFFNKKINGGSDFCPSVAHDSDPACLCTKWDSRRR